MTRPSDSLRPAYEQRAALQYAHAVPLPDPAVDRKFERLVALVSAQLPAETLLDAGCGDGRFLAAIGRLPDAPGRLVGVDIAERILETARETLDREGVTAGLQQANLEGLPFEDASFDRVLSVQVIEHLLDVEAGLGELARVLRPGGRLILSTDSSDGLVSTILNAPRTTAVRLLGLRGRRAKVTFPHRSFRLREITSLVEGAGLTVIHRETFRFHLDGVSSAGVQRVLNRADRAISPHRFGDIVAFVATRR